MQHLILASQSESRVRVLREAGVDFEIHPAHIDETSIIESLQSANASPRDIADALAELKAIKISNAHPNALVLGCDQLLHCNGRNFEKAANLTEARQNLIALRGQKHSLWSAAVIAKGGSAIWRHVDSAELTMRNFSDEFLEWYLEHAGSILTQSVGAYALEGLGVQLFSRIQGDGFTILGLPLLSILDALRIHKVLRT